MVASPPAPPPLTPPAPPAPGIEPELKESPPRPPTLIWSGRPATTGNVDAPEPPAAPSPATVGSIAPSRNEPPSAPIAVAVPQLTPAGTIHSLVPTVVNWAVTAPALVGARMTTGTAASVTAATARSVVRRPRRTGPFQLVAGAPRRR